MIPDIKNIKEIMSLWNKIRPVKGPFFILLILATCILWLGFALFYNNIIASKNSTIETQSERIGQLNDQVNDYRFRLSEASNALVVKEVIEQIKPQPARKLNNEDKAKIEAILKSYNSLNVEVIVYWPLQNEEAHNYGSEWVKVLKESKWKVPASGSLESFALGIVIQTKYELKDPRTSENIRNAVKALNSAFELVDIVPIPEPNEKDLDENQMFLTIGINK